MTRSQRLQRIVALGDVQKMLAAQRLAAARGRHEANQRKLEDFQRYRQEYARSLSAPGQLARAAVMCETRRFLGQLERTISALESMVARSQGECANDLTAWKREAQRANVLIEILERCVRSEDHAREGRLQREIDDRPRLLAALD